MLEPVEFGPEITLRRSEVFDVVALCEEAIERAEIAGETEVAFRMEGVRRFLLGRLMGVGGAPDD